MGSIISGFEYDIFISYRHNDNRSGWVTEFVSALQEELAATIKEPLSIYFDKNPHDGLLETHNVDKSLEGKLKCLIFIPIISQTYCDTKSFAWQHEFVAFNKLAKEDQFGRDIKLSNGNVASRILPIKIHDIDTEDKSIIENEISGVLRAIEFILKSSGVNRPLTSSDKREENLNKTLYRDQVNKVANAIKENIQAMKSPASKDFVSSTQESQVSTGVRKSIGKKVAWITMGLMVLFALVYGVSQYMGSSKTEVIDKSVAVLPFVDLSPEGDQEYLGDGIAEEIINVLVQSPDLKVIARSSSFQFKGKNEDLRTIGNMLGVATILEGSVRKYKNQVCVTAQLINVKDGSHFWSKNFDQNTDNIFVIQDGIAAEVAIALKATLLGGITSAPKIPWNEEAQRLYQQGRYFYDRMDDSSAHELLKRSVAIDSNQAISQLYLSFNYSNLGDTASSRIKLEKAFTIDPLLSEAHTAQALNYLFKLKFDEAYKEINVALSNGANNPVTLRNATRIFQALGRSAEATAFAKKAVELDPVQTRSWSYLVDNYLLDGNYSEALKAIEQAPDTKNDLPYYKVICLLKLNRFSEAEKLIKDQNIFGNYFQVLLNGFKGVKNDPLLKKLEIEFGDKPENGLWLARLFANSGNPDKAMMFINKAVAAKNYDYTLAFDPLYDPLRKDPRFIKLLEELNYPKYKL